MATVLFITRTDLVKNSIIDGNVDTDKFIQFVKVAQEIEIQNYLGTKLYDKIGADISGAGLAGNYLTLVNEYVQPMLIWYAQAEYIPYAAYQIKNGGGGLRRRRWLCAAWGAGRRPFALWPASRLAATICARQ